jgi:hypothetical protein
MAKKKELKWAVYKILFMRDAQGNEVRGGGDVKENRVRYF